MAPGVKNGAQPPARLRRQPVQRRLRHQDTFAAAETSCATRATSRRTTGRCCVCRTGPRLRPGCRRRRQGRQRRPILVAKQAEIKFVGSPTGEVVGMPRFLRIITGDAKAFTNGPANANAHWSCTGFRGQGAADRQVPDRPQGSQVVRSFAFQSCWDGQNIDSANHRTHVAFADAGGNCQNGFKAIPQLTMRLVYDAPQPSNRQRPGQERLCGGRLPGAAAQADHRPRRLHQRHDRRSDEPGGRLHQRRPAVRRRRPDDQPPATSAPSDQPSSGGTTEAPPATAAVPVTTTAAAETAAGTTVAAATRPSSPRWTPRHRT